MEQESIEHAVCRQRTPDEHAAVQQREQKKPPVDQSAKVFRDIIAEEDERRQARKYPRW